MTSTGGPSAYRSGPTKPSSPGSCGRHCATGSRRGRCWPRRESAGTSTGQHNSPLLSAVTLTTWRTCSVAPPMRCVPRCAVSIPTPHRRTTSSDTRAFGVPCSRVPPTAHGASPNPNPLWKRQWTNAMPRYQSRCHRRPTQNLVTGLETQMAVRPFTRSTDSRACTPHLRRSDRAVDGHVRGGPAVNWQAFGSSPLSVIVVGLGHLPLASAIASSSNSTRTRFGSRPAQVDSTGSANTITSATKSACSGSVIITATGRAGRSRSAATPSHLQLLARVPKSPLLKRRSHTLSGLGVQCEPRDRRRMR